MISAENADRRITFDYDPNARLIGRTAWQKDAGGAWTLETRTNVLARDGLPAATTLVWDPITDRLIAFFDSEVVEAAVASGSPSAEAGLLRQIVHGDQAYDDPMEVLIADDLSGAPRHYYPIVDEAGSGSLQAVVDADGALVERVLYADAYGDAPRYLHGAVVEQVRVDVAGEARTIHVAFSEALDPATISAESIRLAAIGADGEILRIHPGSAIADGERSVTWSIDAGEWSALVSGATSVRISAASSLRFPAWGDAHLQDVTAWEVTLGRAAAPSADYPFNRELSLSQFEATRKLYDIPDLYLVAREESRARLHFDFHTLPFREPATKLVYVRARWYDSSLGMFLTPDPMGYADSSDLYAGFGGDPVNNHDPSGQWIESAWDATSFVMGIRQISQWNDETSTWTKALDLIGVGMDGVALALPIVPGGVSAFIKASRTGSAIIDAASTASQTIRIVDAGHDVDRAGDAARMVAHTSDPYLVSARRIARFEAKLKQLQVSGAKGERLAELSGRIKMLKEGYLREGHGMYEVQTRVIKIPTSGKEIKKRVGGKGIDSVYSKYDDFVKSGFESRIEYRAALAGGEVSGSLAILESKWRGRFSIGGMVESLLGRGIRDAAATGRVYFRQMSPDWVKEVTRRLRGSSVPGAAPMGSMLRRNPAAERFINVLNGDGQSVLHQMR